MIAFAQMLLAPAEKAGMKVPPSTETYDRNEFPHFFVYASIQLGSPMPTPTSHWHNARVIAEVDEEKIKTLSFDDLKNLGIEVGYPTP
jgi:hypothetical protein